ncbi:hypothetical protein METBIDRAFT_12634 [Metschnikowia bicuspidata var. bicuspidata NRRL YB-4993]|uniref:BZIP domain-containing protein n=1 Tax=Metschnikowia bicuspidata var. bicuspidata NRRL YB-4993 TaxID=869754 RepID=A0A1A0H9L0_9ASCO|nr:hypothetical protein METBIDRAFT_12634 [Metschnikowia bicuspidata var. bicuspidata NRRL YB-4993]OBA20675.1 hypothetical protein METBIDRAFT_12634 [Metschnikowia bicuspidata var. bicuspidata NRRL YB-4993]
MTFQPSDYLSNLNLVFDNSDVSPLDEASHNADLGFFSQTDFFDLDVFSHDFAAREKQNMSLKMPLHPANMAAKTEPEYRVPVKQEEIDSAVVGPHGSSTKATMEMSPGLATSSPCSSTEPANPADTMEVKRRRNTAASARFRVKKKLKEKEMEQRARDLQDRLGLLEKKLRTLEMENKCLRQLIVEKTEKKNSDLLESIKKRSLGGMSSDGYNTANSFTYTN